MKVISGSGRRRHSPAALVMMRVSKNDAKRRRKNDAKRRGKNDAKRRGKNDAKRRGKNDAKRRGKNDALPPPRRLSGAPSSLDPPHGRPRRWPSPPWRQPPARP
jgi:hypothetical protein